MIMGDFTSKWGCNTKAPAPATKTPGILRSHRYRPLTTKLRRDPSWPPDVRESCADLASHFSPYSLRTRLVIFSHQFFSPFFSPTYKYLVFLSKRGIKFCVRIGCPTPLILWTHLILSMMTDPPFLGKKSTRIDWMISFPYPSQTPYISLSNNNAPYSSFLIIPIIFQWLFTQTSILILSRNHSFIAEGARFFSPGFDKILSFHCYPSN